MSRATVLVLGLLLGALGLAPWEGAAEEPSPPRTAVDHAWASAHGAVLNPDKRAKPVRITKPEYPKDAFRRKIEGTVVLEIVIDAAGQVSAVRVVQSIPGLDQAAIDCVKSWTFAPAVKGDKPVATVARAPVTFRIHGDEGLDYLSMSDPDGRSLMVTSFDSKNAAFGKWMALFKIQVFDHWTLPKRLQSGPPRSVELELVIERDGSVSKVRRVRPSASEMAEDTALLDLEKSAEDAVRSGPLPLLPVDYEPARLELQVRFSAQEKPPSPLGPTQAHAPAPSPPPVDEDWARAHGLVADYDQRPAPLEMTEPEYPQTASEKRVEGTVLLDLAIDARGRVVDARVAESVPTLDGAAVDCVKRWKFKPALKGGKPVAVLARAPVIFRLPGGELPGVFSPRAQREDGRHLMVMGFDSKGANFMQWFSRFESEVFSHWDAPKGLAANPAPSVTFQFNVARDGRISKISRYEPFASSIDIPAVQQLQRSAHSALHASRLPPLPAEYSPDRITLRVSFSIEKPTGPSGTR
jgi:TonB family protein